MCVRDVDVQCVLQFTLINAAGCALHRRTSRVIHRLELYLRPHKADFRRRSSGNDLAPRREPGGPQSEADSTENRRPGGPALWVPVQASVISLASSVTERDGRTPPYPAGRQRGNNRDPGSRALSRLSSTRWPAAGERSSVCNVPETLALTYLLAFLGRAARRQVR